MVQRPEHPSLPEGTVVAGKLRVVRELGVGGMGTVYEVEHELTRHRRALKILHARAAQEPNAVARFLREASAAARIGNTHIAETFDAGRLDTGEPYLLMELLEGETLDQRVQRLGAIVPYELVDLMVQACDGVQAAHDAGIVHRDLKPENLFVTAREGKPFVKLLDFGISKFDAERTGSLGVTNEGVLIGTPYYMPPEQVRGERTLDAKADIYALGVILYECAAGARPYEAATVEHLAVLIHEGKATPLAERSPGLPRAFCDAVHRAMAVERDLRFGSARELAAALTASLGGSRRSARPSAGPSPTVGEDPAPGGRVVIRPSSSPRALDFVTTASPTSATLTATGLAETMATEPPPPLAAPATSRRALVIGGLAAMAAGGIALAIALGSRTEAPAPASSLAPSGAVPGISAAAAPSVSLAPGPAASRASAPSAALSAPLPEPSASAGAAALAASAHAPGPGAKPMATGAPVPATSPSKSRVDQSGLAGENPFR